MCQYDLICSDSDVRNTSTVKQLTRVSALRYDLSRQRLTTHRRSEATAKLVRKLGLFISFL